MSNTTKIVAGTLNITEDMVRRVMGTYAETVLIQAAFQGPVSTVFGEFSLSDSGLSISKQNPRVVALATTDLSRDELLESIVAVVAEQGR